MLKAPYSVLQAVNSFVGRNGNIGQRTGFIIDELRERNIATSTIARGAVRKYADCTFGMGLFGHSARALNAYRIYCNIKFDQRRYDRYIFETFAGLKLDRAVRKLSPFGRPILHCWEWSPKLIRRAKQLGCLVVVDVPIAPSLYSKELHDRNLMRLDWFNFDRELELEQQTFELADRIIVPSDFVNEIVKRYGIDERKVVTIPFGVSLPASEALRPARTSKSKLRFVFTGSINLRKGITYLLEAFNSTEFKNDELHLCGRLFPEQAAMIKEMGNSNVFTPGFVDVSEYFKSCDVFILPTLMEGSSKSVYEAMISGLPIITTAAAGSICRDGVDGYIVPEGNSLAIRSAMLKFKEAPQLVRQMGKSAMMQAACFPWTRYATAVVSEYESLVLNGVNSAAPISSLRKAETR